MATTGCCCSRVLAFADDAERTRAEGLLQRYLVAVRAAANGAYIDNASDLARVLKVPGTLNWKLPHPRPVRLIGRDGAALHRR